MDILLTLRFNINLLKWSVVNNFRLLFSILYCYEDTIYLIIKLVDAYNSRIVDLSQKE